MHDIARWASGDRTKLFEDAADKLKLHPAIVEKDFWVCCILDILFQSKEWGPHLMFKGGTSLSKVFGLIDRFSEDIDLILDWNIIGYTIEKTWQERSRTQDGVFSDKMNTTSVEFLKNRFLPSFNAELSQHRLDGVTGLIDKQDPQCVVIRYPFSFNRSYIQPELRLEIGPLAAWALAL